MSPRKCFFGCEGKLILFAFPKEESTRQHWIQFLFTGQKQSYATVFVCSRHFTEDSFLNRAQYEAGFSARLVLKDGAVPCVKGRVSESSTSQQTSTTHVTTQYRHTGSQTDPEPTVSVATQFCPLMLSVGTQLSYSASTKSVGTQLSYSTLKQHVRSKATQVTSCNDFGVGTTTGPLMTPQPLMTSTHITLTRPAKRSRLELDEEEKEEEEQEEEDDYDDDDDDDSVSMEGLEPHDSTCDPADSVSTEWTNMSPSSSPIQNIPKYLVYETCLLELFEMCPVCQKACRVRRRRLGTFLAVDQLCPHCKFSRQWKSQPIVGSTPAGNLQLSAAVYLTGASFFKLKKTFRAMHVKVFQYDTFRRHARMFLEPAIIYKWNRAQEVMLQRLSQDQKVIVGGDMRTDSPGHSAMFGSYSMMDLKSNTVIDIQLVQVSEYI
ncbi:uncharacterized protein ACJ7VT_007047 [Polymixia lowei]